jgi:hypothetical protein
MPKYHVSVSGYDRGKKKDPVYYRFLTRDEILNLSYSHCHFLANDGTIRNLKVNGKVRTWKRNPNRIEVPIKYGMYEFTMFDLEESLRRLVRVVSKVEYDLNKEESNV